MCVCVRVFQMRGLSEVFHYSKWDPWSRVDWCPFSSDFRWKHSILPTLWKEKQRTRCTQTYGGPFLPLPPSLSPSVWPLPEYEASHVKPRQEPLHACAVLVERILTVHLLSWWLAGANNAVFSVHVVKLVQQVEEDLSRVVRVVRIERGVSGTDINQSETNGVKSENGRGTMPEYGQVRSKQVPNHDPRFFLPSCTGKWQSVVFKWVTTPLSTRKMTTRSSLVQS